MSAPVKVTPRQHVVLSRLESIGPAHAKRLTSSSSILKALLAKGLAEYGGLAVASSGWSANGEWAQLAQTYRITDAGRAWLRDARGAS